MGLSPYFLTYCPGTHTITLDAFSLSHQQSLESTTTMPEPHLFNFFSQGATSRHPESHCPQPVSDNDLIMVSVPDSVRFQVLEWGPPSKQDYYPWFNGTVHPQCLNHFISIFGQKLSHHSRSGLLRSLSHGLHIAVDFVTGLLLSHSNTTTIDDHSSKSVHFIPLYML